VPGLDALAACFQGLNFGIQLPNFDGLAKCITDLAPSVDVSLPNIDPNAMLACFTNVDFSIDIHALTSNLAGLIRAVMDIIASLKNLKLKVLVKFDPSFFAALRALANMCRRAGPRGRPINPARVGTPFL